MVWMPLSVTPLLLLPMGTTIGCCNLCAESVALVQSQIARGGRRCMPASKASTALIAARDENLGNSRTTTAGNIGAQGRSTSWSASGSLMPWIHEPTVAGLRDQSGCYFAG